MLSKLAVLLGVPSAVLLLAYQLGVLTWSRSIMIVLCIAVLWRLFDSEA